ncbi:unnamed protein product [Absidia cylindrospora]
MNTNTPPMIQSSTLPPPSINDPPKKSKRQESDELDIEDLKTRLTALVRTCQETFTTGPSKRIADDTSKRIQNMLKEMDSESVEANVIGSINDLCQALEDKDWETALTIHRQLMTTEYERHGSWLLGCKRLIDLSEKVPSS